MAEAALWGLAGASSLLIGVLIGLSAPIPDRAIGLVLGFGAGTLISALAFELTEDAFALGGADAVAIGLALGAIAYFAGDTAIERRGGADRMSKKGRQPAESSTALLLGAVLDGIPESAVIGITLLAGKGVGFPVLAAVFLSNLPESLSSSKGMKKAGAPTRHVIRVWTVVVLVSGLAAALGYGLLQSASGNVVGTIEAFAAGAVLTMLADTMMPEAFEDGGRAVGLVTVLGFALAYLLSTLE
jgi:zinc transporter, ZIP family